MRGDMGMLAATCEKWLTKTTNKSILIELPDYMLTNCRQVKITKYLGLNDFILASVDFHCFPNIIYKIVDKHPDLSPELVKRCLWLMSSSLNYRLETAKVSTLISETFSIIKQDYHEIAKKILYYCH